MLNSDFLKDWKANKCYQLKFSPWKNKVWVLIQDQYPHVFNYRNVMRTEPISLNRNYSVRYLVIFMSTVEGAIFLRLSYIDLISTTFSQSLDAPGEHKVPKVSTKGNFYNKKIVRKIFFWAREKNWFKAQTFLTQTYKLKLRMFYPQEECFSCYRTTF